MNAIHKLFEDVQRDLGSSYILDECDKMLLVRGYVRGSLNEAMNADKNAEELAYIRKEFG